MMLSRPSQGTLHYKELTLFIKGWILGPPLSASSIAMFSNKKIKKVGGWTNWEGGIKRKVKVSEWERERQTLRPRASVLQIPCNATFKSNWRKEHVNWRLIICSRYVVNQGRVSQSQETTKIIQRWLTCYTYGKLIFGKACRSSYLDT